MQEETTQDGWGGMPNGWGQRGNYGKPTSLQQHDNIYHGGHYDGGSCKFRKNQSASDPADVLPGFETFVSSRHGMFDDAPPQYSPQELDQMAVADVCAKNGVEYPRRGKVKSGRWSSLSDPKLEYTVVDRDTGLFASGRAERDYMVLARPEEAMSFSDPYDAAAVAKATGKNAAVLDRKGYAAFLSSKAKNPVTFPKSLTEGDLDGFRVTLNGSTEPFVGKIGHTTFIAKRGTHTSDDHVRNEDLANRVHREQGLRAPQSRIYKVKGAKDTRTPAQKYMDEVNGVKGPFSETVMLAEYIPNAVALDAAWNDAKRNRDKAKMDKIRDEVLKAYPLESFLAGIDVFQNDNALVDDEGNVYFVDNGAAFDYRARGGRKGWFNNRTDPEDPEHGHMSLLNHPSQKLLQDILKGVTEKDILASTRNYDFEAIVKSLPPEYQTPGLKQYATALNKLSGRKKYPC